MNERIRELAEQAEDWADSQNFYASDYRDYLMERFAELIVRESIVDFYRRYLDLESEEDITEQVNRYVKEHFGIKE